MVFTRPHARGPFPVCANSRAADSAGERTHDHPAPGYVVGRREVLRFVRVPDTK